MDKYVCSVCGYVYDETKGSPEHGIAPGTAWDDIPEDWVCPLCGAAKSEFIKQGEAGRTAVKKIQPEYREEHSADEQSSDMKELSPMEVSALCTNLARGCEKQYKPDEAALFNELAGYFKDVAAPEKNPDFDQLMKLIENDLDYGLAEANEAAAYANDRGAKRALVWSEKVTRILKSLLLRYQREGDSMLYDTGVYVCTICGFIYIGDILPEVCPICKVPNWKFERVEGGMAHV